MATVNNNTNLASVEAQTLSAKRAVGTGAALVGAFGAGFQAGVHRETLSNLFNSAVVQAKNIPGRAVTLFNSFFPAKQVEVVTIAAEAAVATTPTAGASFGQFVASGKELASNGLELVKNKGNALLASGKELASNGLELVKSKGSVLLVTGSALASSGLTTLKNNSATLKKVGLVATASVTALVVLKVLGNKLNDVLIQLQNKQAKEFNSIMLRQEFQDTAVKTVPALQTQLKRLEKTLNTALQVVAKQAQAQNALALELNNGKVKVAALLLQARLAAAEAPDSDSDSDVEMEPVAQPIVEMEPVAQPIVEMEPVAQPMSRLELLTEEFNSKSSALEDLKKSVANKKAAEESAQDELTKASKFILPTSKNKAKKEAAAAKLEESRSDLAIAERLVYDQQYIVNDTQDLLKFETRKTEQERSAADDAHYMALREAAFARHTQTV